MSLDQEAINQQLALLSAHRRTLAHLLEQAAAYGGVILAPSQTAAGIEEARGEIARIKEMLREGGVEVEDEPNDEAPPQADISPAGGAGPRVESTVTVQDNKGTVVGAQFNQPNWAVTGNGTNVAGDQRTINTQGGDYAEGNIDKRQGNYISGGTVQGPVIADNQGTVNLNYNYQQRSTDQALHQLRAPVGDFVGREREIDRLVQALTRTNGAAADIGGVRGMGGIGKTELAYVVANRLKDAFPDAQLVVELRGASASPLSTEQALQTLIRAFEREIKLPDDLSELQNIFCSMLSGKRVLILADDAKDARAGAPTLAASGLCAVGDEPQSVHLARDETARSGDTAS